MQRIRQQRGLSGVPSVQPLSRCCACCTHVFRDRIIAQFKLCCAFGSSTVIRDILHYDMRQPACLGALYSCRNSQLRSHPVRLQGHDRTAATEQRAEALNLGLRAGFLDRAGCEVRALRHSVGMVGCKMCRTCRAGAWSDSLRSPLYAAALGQSTAYDALAYTCSPAAAVRASSNNTLHSKIWGRTFTSLL